MKELHEGDLSPEKADGRERGELDAALDRDFDDTPDRVYTKKQRENYRKWYKIGYDAQRSLEAF